MRARRMFRSRKVYEICFRARKGIPLPARPLLNLLLESALARTQRDHKVEICHHMWMGNHPHILVLSRDIEDLKRFYEELKKRITESIKRLIGESHLSLWEDGTMVAEILDLEKVIDRISYLYLNPCKARLVTSIDEYPGLNSWRCLCEAPASLSGQLRKEIPWILMPSIPRLSNIAFSKKEEKRIIGQLLDANKNVHPLIIMPFAWLKAFGINTPNEIEEIRQKIISRVRKIEEEFRSRCNELKLSFIGSQKLLMEGISFDHAPTKKERRIFVLSSSKELRNQFIATFKHFCANCVECYVRLKQGYIDIKWPLGAFKPSGPPLANPLF